MSKRGSAAPIEVIRSVRNVDISDSDGLVPDAKCFAEKYDMELDEEDVSSGIGCKDETEVLKEIVQNQDLVQRTDALVRKLDEKNREVERLCTLLESVTMVPGMNPERVLNIYDNIAEEPIDLRDSKIVHLAKKVRSLTVALNKERSLRATSDGREVALKREIEKLQRELQLLASPAARAAARGEGKDSDSSPSVSKDTKKELSTLNKQIEELRHKLHSTSEENKRIQRALIKEIGDGTSLEQALDDGWKGRAQQIVMLKNKIKRLEMGNIDGSLFSGEAAASRASNRRDVDSKAENELAEMSSERQRAVEQLTIDHNKLSQDYQELRQKAERQKVRIRSLETDTAKHKENLKMMVDKGDSDDQLIEALKEENQQLRDTLQKMAQKHREDAQFRVPREARATGVAAPSTGTDLESEITRLNRLIKQQAAQIETQDILIRKFRSTENNHRYS